MIASESKVTEAFVGSWNVLEATLPNENWQGEIYGSQKCATKN